MIQCPRTARVVLAAVMGSLVTASAVLVAQPDLDESVSEPPMAISVSLPATAQPPNPVETQPTGALCEAPPAPVGPDQEIGFHGWWEREPISDAEATAFPVSAIVHIQSSLDECTGVMYGPDIVLTAGHCLFLNDRWATEVKVSPGRSAQVCPFGRCGAVRLFTTRGWKERADEAFDYGAIKLNCSIGSRTGWFGYDAAPGGVTASTPLHLYGYPRFRNNPLAQPRPAVQTMAAQAELIQPRVVFYKHDTDKGDSGAPLFTADLRVRIVHNMGCHALPGDPPLVDGGRQCATSGSDHARLNHGVRITDRVAANLAAWRHAR